MAAPRNVLFVTADQWRAECLSMLGHQVQTPNLDALAQDGTLFRRHFANAAPCGPSRASIHTGLYQHNHRVINNGTPLSVRHANWAAIARAAGYDPVLFGYTDTTTDPASTDEWASSGWDGVLPGLRPIVELGKEFSEPTSWADWVASKGYSVPARIQDLYTQKQDQPEWEAGGPEAAPLAVPAELHDTAFLTDAALDHIHSNASWCVHLSLLRPHPPFVAPEPYNRMYPPDSLPGFVRATDAEIESGQHPYLRYALSQRYSRTPADERVVRRLQASYFGLMSEVDFHLGRIFAALKASGAWEHTLIIVTSDHGEQMGDHWLMGKLGYFDQSFAVPLIIHNPDADVSTRGVTRSEFTESVDLMPTILDWLELPAPVHQDGASLLPFQSRQAGDVTSAPAPWRDHACWEFDFSGPAASAALGLDYADCKLNVLRTAQYKYVHFPTLPPLLFDLTVDPGELRNVAEEPEYQSMLRAAALKLLSWRMRSEDVAMTHLQMTDAGLQARSPSQQ